MRFIFDDFELNVAHRRFAKDGVTIATEPKVLDVLLYLIQNRDRVVPRDELLNMCWPNIYVSDGTLSRCLSRVRQALDQPRAATAPIQTVHSKGYRFAAELSIKYDAEPAAEPEASESAADRAAPASDRHFVSVVHCVFGVDTEYAEVAHGNVLALSSACHEIASGYGCDVVVVLGSQVTIVVGFPKPTEYPARLAILVASEMLDGARALGVGIRISVASGIAIIDTVAGDPVAGPMLVGVEPVRVVGKVPADLSELLLDDRTAQLAGDSVEVELTKRMRTDGEEVSLYRVREPRSMGLARFDDAEPLFVGRDRELIHIGDLWVKARAGAGQIAVVSGKPGIGKSGLVKEFLRRDAVPEDAVLKVQCSPYHANTPFYPLMILLREILGIEIDSPPLKLLQVIEGFLERIEQPATDHLPLLASLLTASTPARRRLDLSLSTQRRRERTMEAVLFMIASAAQSAPIVLWIDDVQWADPSTKDTVTRLIDRVPSLRLMVILCNREGPEGDFPGLENAKRFPLDRMQHGQCVRLLSELSERGLLPSGLIDVIANRSDGVPLYLREIVRMASAEADDGRKRLADAHAIPDSLQGLLATRLEVGGAARAVVQWGSVIGTTASRDLLHRVCDMSKEELNASLQQLTQAGILQAEQRGDGLNFSFSHALMRDAAYESMRVGVRREHHMKVAETLRDHFPQVAASEPERIAIHYAASTEPRNAAKYWQAAGEASVEKHALAEAHALFKQALESARLTPQGKVTETLVAEIEAMLATF